ncbi:glycoside hydrolase family 17 protein [[Candida] arabinofermentans NRRL YB-2248]|uniref:glucan endo-1,3-beta-D-glucosidase n=1 Tax=[Candida] arabinofermentans NRRL YB-2248 TaxID=983967 RepID=A0A1E4T0K2_9ASCO|nr:glycoside hydrolase family 17 protein [[Candida] arabinofermentans NRRL YB-2248]
MTLALGIWIGPDNYVNWKQLNDMKSVLNKFPRKYFDSIFIGNEVMFRSDKSVLELMEYVDEARMFTNSIGYGDIPIGTSELGSQIKEEMISNCDFVGANIHPFFGGEDVKIATRWTLDFVTGQVVPFMSKIKENVDLVISEVGWPSGGGRFMEANAGTAELQDFLETWVCQMQEMNLKWFYFEAFDEPWKKIWHTEESKWETQWGVFTQDRKLKEGIVLPSCKGRTVLIS